MAFDQDKPAAATSLRKSNPEILDNQEALQDAINREHIFSGTETGTQTGDHTQGSARAFSQESAPTTRIDGDNFLSTDLGSIWIRPSDSQISTLTATTPTWTPISTELYATFLASPRVFLDTLGVTGDFAVNTDKFTVDATTGNAVVAGTLDVAGAAEIIGIGTLGDASTLKTAAAPTADAEIANKKYVNDQDASITDPAYTGGQSHTFGGGLTIKQGTASSEGTVTFATPFDTACVNVQLTMNRDSAGSSDKNVSVRSIAAANFKYGAFGTGAENIYWIAIGY